MRKKKGEGKMEKSKMDSVSPDDDIRGQASGE